MLIFHFFILYVHYKRETVYKNVLIVLLPFAYQISPDLEREAIILVTRPIEGPIPRDAEGSDKRTQGCRLKEASYELCFPRSSSAIEHSL